MSSRSTRIFFPPYFETLCETVSSIIILYALYYEIFCCMVGLCACRSSRIEMFQKYLFILSHLVSIYCQCQCPFCMTIRVAWYTYTGLLITFLTPLIDFGARYQFYCRFIYLRIGTNAALFIEHSN